MPKIAVVFYQENAKTVPVLDWLDRLPTKAQDKCRVRMEQLRDLGHELRRPEADYLRDGIYELRVGLQGIELSHALFLSREDCRGSCTWIGRGAGSAVARDRGSDSEKAVVLSEPRTTYLQGGLIMQRKKRKASTDAVEILHRRYYHGKPERLAALERARADDHASKTAPRRRSVSARVFLP